MIPFLSARTFCVSSLLFGVALSASLVAADVSPAEETNPSVRTKVVPTLESLPHTRLPKGVFGGWCGTTDRYLLEVDGQLEAYDAGTKVATIAVASSWPRQCSGDGQQLVHVDTRMGYVTKVDIASGASRLIASYNAPQVDPSLSFSTDLKTVAASGELKLTADAGSLKVIRFATSDEKGVRSLRWSNDSSKFYSEYFGVVDVFDRSGGKIGSGHLPNKSYVRDGWFDVTQQALILFLALEIDESGPGLMVRCRIAPWKCERLRSRVDSVSVGGRGILGSVAPLGKTVEAYDDTIVIYPRYAVDIQDSAVNLLARQVYLTATGRRYFTISVSPSGMKAVVSWDNERLAGCGVGAATSFCREGITIDLSKVLK